MRLEQHVNAPKPAQAGSIESSANFGGVMSVIVHYGDAALLTTLLEAAIDAVERSQALAAGVRLNFELHRDSDGGHGIEHVVAARDGQGGAAGTRRAIARVYIPHTT